ncbi:hypothetical protein GQ43DRAFT_483985 [Delitschia confertaspora ATCC 74209]|uniref:Enoyl reductase (ER) domain-containing protein n=1 Tax=Delitschia confertaspora ATCC 74209 TaxID=1513339 RepID=A0A9P4MV38_9PLEO|nr:hypothetical protein GQ43DRAFT_483985 [Delitschia confertaspora ATCC 74209]
MAEPQIPSTQTVAWIDTPGPNGKLVIRNGFEVEQPGKGEVLVKMECSGICHSDCRNVEGMGKYTDIPGHEGIGTVVSLGPSVDSSLMNKRVGIKWLYSACNNCAACRAGRINNCPYQLNTGRSTRGTLQQYFLAAADFVTMIPEGLASEIAAPLLCAGLSLAGAVGLCEPEVKKGEWVVIIGAGGGLGHIGVQIAARVKGYKVIAIDSGKDKEELCKEMGAEAFVDYAKDDVINKVKELTDGEGAHAVICVAGSEKAYEQAPSLVRNLGVVVCVGLPPDTFMFPMSPIQIANRGLIIKGSSTGTSAQMDELLQFALEKKITPKIDVYEFNESPQIIQRLLKYEVTGRKVVKAPV